MLTPPALDTTTGTTGPSDPAIPSTLLSTASIPALLTFRRSSSQLPLPHLIAFIPHCRAPLSLHTVTRLIQSRIAAAGHVAELDLRRLREVLDELVLTPDPAWMNSVLKLYGLTLSCPPSATTATTTTAIPYDRLWDAIRQCNRAYPMLSYLALNPPPSIVQTYLSTIAGPHWQRLRQLVGSEDYTGLVEDLCCSGRNWDGQGIDGLGILHRDIVVRIFLQYPALHPLPDPETMLDLCATHDDDVVVLISRDPHSYFPPFLALLSYDVPTLVEFLSGHVEFLAAFMQLLKVPPSSWQGPTEEDGVWKCMRELERWLRRPHVEQALGFRVRPLVKALQGWAGTRTDDEGGRGI